MLDLLSNVKPFVSCDGVLEQRLQHWLTAVVLAVVGSIHPHDIHYTEHTNVNRGLGVLFQA